MQTTRQFDVIILGAGAAGLMAAIEAGRRRRRTLVLDHADRPGKKILISGGGRCNFTNLQTTSENFLSENPHFARSALTRYTPQDFVALVEKHHIRYHEKTLGQLFCDRSARDILDALLEECAEAQVRIDLATTILSVSRGENKFAVETPRGRFEAHSVIVATGGLSIPQMGATSLGYDLARQFGIAVVDPRPSLVPLTLQPEDKATWCDLSGVSAEVVASTGKKKLRNTPDPGFREKLLITHRGLSGPVILQISSYWRSGETIRIDLAPGRQVFAPLLAPHARRDSHAAAAAVHRLLPGRWAERWLDVYPSTAPNDLTNAAIARLEAQLHAWTLMPSGTEGFAKAEVTGGGVATAELDPRTLESRKVPGLFFIGEVVDVTGWLGGYNFQWAWSSGFAAGQSA